METPDTSPNAPETERQSCQVRVGAVLSTICESAAEAFIITALLLLLGGVAIGLGGAGYIL